jgi:hypothetical protein
MPSSREAAARPAVKVVPHLAEWAVVGEYPYRARRFLLIFPASELPETSEGRG